MTVQNRPPIVIERINQECAKDFYDAVFESRQELFTAGFIQGIDFTLEEVENWIKEFVERWENETQYHFQIIETTSNQFVGGVFLNHIERGHKMANLGYWVRTNRVGEGIATEAAKQAARYGFEKLGFQRIEILVSKDNTTSLRIAEKVGAYREGLLRNRLQIQGSSHDAYMHSLIPTDFGINDPA